jgi:tRNA (uracil-5-)-methyltransferase TRM9
MNAFEEKNVLEPYNHISSHFKQTRVFLWPFTKSFLDTIKAPELVADIGCGNGRGIKDYPFPVIGCDICIPNLIEANTQLTGVIRANALNLPYNNNVFDKLISIAVIHHLSTNERRQQVIKEMIRVVKPGGKLFIQVWALEQPKNARRQFKTQDNMVPWVLYKKYTKEKKHDEVYKRFYHVFKENELELLCDLPTVECVKSFYEKGNWGIILEKCKQAQTSNPM